MMCRLLSPAIEPVRQGMQAIAIVRGTQRTQYATSTEVALMKNALLCDRLLSCEDKQGPPDLKAV